MSSREHTPGSFAAQRYLARRERLEALLKALDEPSPDVARLLISVSAALHNAVALAKLTRATEELHPTTFIARFVRLDVFIEWLKESSDAKSASPIWSSDPGCTFALKAGSSSLDVSRKFSESIYNACVIARSLVRIPSNDLFWDDQLVHPKPSQAIDNWTQLALEELRARVIPLDHVWPVMGHIHRDYESLCHKLGHEYDVARSRALERPVDLRGLAAETVDQIERYVAYRRGLFHELVKLRHLEEVWQVQYKRDPVEGDATLPPRITHQTGIVTALGDVDFEGIATIKHPETYAPFSEFRLIDAEQKQPPAGSDAAGIELRIGFLLNQLLKVVKAIIGGIDTVQRTLANWDSNVDLTPITRFHLALPVFPYWPQIKGMTEEKYEAVLTEEKPIVEEAKVALRQIQITQKATPRIVADARIAVQSKYEHCLRVIFDAGRRMEALPSTYSGKGEDALRDHFVTILSSHFQSVTSETFNRAGKTDIFVRDDGIQVLVAECKIWKGRRGFLSTIDQVLSYLPWRDARATVIMFIRNRRLRPVLKDAVAATQTHPCFVSVGQTIDEAWTNFNFRADTDPTRTLQLAVMCFHFPDEPSKIGPSDAAPVD